jgi:hypothetical protein
VADEERSASSKGVDRRIDIQPAEDEDGKKKYSVHCNSF